MLSRNYSPGPFSEGPGFSNFGSRNFGSSFTPSYVTANIPASYRMAPISSSSRVKSMDYGLNDIPSLRSIHDGDYLGRMSRIRPPPLNTSFLSSDARTRELRTSSPTRHESRLPSSLQGSTSSHRKRLDPTWAASNWQTSEHFNFAPKTMFSYKAPVYRSSPRRIDYSEYFRPLLQSRPILKIDYKPRPRAERDKDSAPIIRERKQIKFREASSDIVRNVRRKISWVLPDDIESLLGNEPKENENGHLLSNISIRSRESSLTFTRKCSMSDSPKSSRRYIRDYNSNDAVVNAFSDSSGVKSVTSVDECSSSVQTLGKRNLSSIPFKREHFSKSHSLSKESTNTCFLPREDFSETFFSNNEAPSLAELKQSFKRNSSCGDKLSTECSDRRNSSVSSALDSLPIVGGHQFAEITENKESSRNGRRRLRQRTVCSDSANDCDDIIKRRCRSRSRVSESEEKMVSALNGESFSSRSNVDAKASTTKNKNSELENIIHPPPRIFSGLSPQNSKKESRILYQEPKTSKPYSRTETTSSKINECLRNCKTNKASNEISFDQRFRHQDEKQKNTTSKVRKLLDKSTFVSSNERNERGDHNHEAAGKYFGSSCAYDIKDEHTGSSEIPKHNENVRLTSWKEQAKLGKCGPLERITINNEDTQTKKTKKSLNQKDTSLQQNKIPKQENVKKDLKCEMESDKEEIVITCKLPRPKWTKPVACSEKSLRKNEQVRCESSLENSDGISTNKVSFEIKKQFGMPTKKGIKTEETCLTLRLKDESRRSNKSKTKQIPELQSSKLERSSGVSPNEYTQVTKPENNLLKENSSGFQNAMKISFPEKPNDRIDLKPSSNKQDSKKSHTTENETVLHHKQHKQVGKSRKTELDTQKSDQDMTNRTTNFLETDGSRGDAINKKRLETERDKYVKNDTDYINISKEGENRHVKAIPMSAKTSKLNVEDAKHSQKVTTPSFMSGQKTDKNSSVLPKANDDIRSFEKTLELNVINEQNSAPKEMKKSTTAQNIFDKNFSADERNDKRKEINEVKLANTVLSSEQKDFDGITKEEMKASKKVSKGDSTVLLKNLEDNAERNNKTMTKYGDLLSDAKEASSKIIASTVETGTRNNAKVAKRDAETTRIPTASKDSRNHLNVSGPNRNDSSFDASAGSLTLFARNEIQGATKIPPTEEKRTENKLNCVQAVPENVCSFEEKVNSPKSPPTCEKKVTSEGRLTSREHLDQLRKKNCLPVVREDDAIIIEKRKEESVAQSLNESSTGISLEELPDTANGNKVSNRRTEISLNEDISPSKCKVPSSIKVSVPPVVQSSEIVTPQNAVSALTDVSTCGDIKVLSTENKSVKNETLNQSPDISICSSEKNCLPVVREDDAIIIEKKKEESVAQCLKESSTGISLKELPDTANGNKVSNRRTEISLNEDISPSKCKVPSSIEVSVPPVVQSSEIVTPQNAVSALTDVSTCGDVKVLSTENKSVKNETLNQRSGVSICSSKNSVSDDENSRTKTVEVPDRSIRNETETISEESEPIPAAAAILNTGVINARNTQTPVEVKSQFPPLPRKIGLFVKPKEVTATKDNSISSQNGVQQVSNKCNATCHQKCEKHMPNLCGVNQKLLSEILETVKKGRTSEKEDQSHPRSSGSTASLTSSISTNTTYSTLSDVSTLSEDFRNTSLRSPQKKLRFRKYGIEDFNLLKLLGKGSFGKVLLAELKGNEMYFAVKCLKKDVVLEDDDVESTMIERRILALGTQHPYMCKLYCTFQTESHLCFVMEYLNGGDLMFHIQESGRFEQNRAMFYGAEVASALRFLHKRGIVYRDMKLDNVVMDEEGHIRLVDFGMCQCRIYREECMPFNFCGTPQYIAPEIVSGQKYNQSVDWWSFGVLLYEMLTGKSPFNGTDEDELFWSICNEEPHYPRFLTKESRHILGLLLTKTPDKRLGMPSCAAGEITQHAFFSPIDWNKLEKKQIRPPFKPAVKFASDTSNFDSNFTMDTASLTPVDNDILESMDQQQFRGFSYTNPHITG